MADISSEQTIPEALTAAGAYSHDVIEPIRMIETHMSYIFLTGLFAYKVKKPVVFDFLDFSTRGRRKYFCHQEVRVNRQFAPLLYQGVVPIVLDNGRVHVGDLIKDNAASPTVEDADAVDNDSSDVLDWAVRMTQFDPALEADALVRQHLLTRSELFGFGGLLAAQHSNIPPVTAPLGPAVLGERAPIIDNFNTLERLPCAGKWAAELRALRAHAEQCLASTDDLCARRRAHGFTRECHGDLHLGNMVLIDGKLSAFDCVEFDVALRNIDVWADCAFLVMDCCVKGHPDLAYAFIDGYLNASGDYAGACLLPLFTQYRALVRAKVAALLLHQQSSAAAALPQGKQDVPSSADAKMRASEKSLAQYVTWAYNQQQRPPGHLYVMCGLSGSGKSFWAAQLAPALHAVRVRSDVLRKHVHGLASSAASASRVAGGLYSAEKSQQLYADMAALAVRLLQSGEHVVIDACCLKTPQRQCLYSAATTAGAAAATLVHVTAPDAILRARIAQRHAQTAARDASEGTTDVLDWQIKTCDPVDAATEGVDVREIESLDTTTLADVLRSVGAE
eukprot:m.273188 g.273188  ORF g.273188 m.273188 type:complete len:563 (-) comp19755_c0_seq5:1342-3030(-)